MDGKACCGRPLRRLGKAGHRTWFQCLKCRALFAQDVGSKRVKRQKC